MLHQVVRVYPSLVLDGALIGETKKKHVSSCLELAALSVDFDKRNGMAWLLQVSTPPLKIFTGNMRLLNTVTEQARDFLPHDVPRYAILSHTWGAEEVTFQDLESQNFQHLKGYAKLHGSCRVARTEGYDWIWIDTCCIDKTSSAELSEAINSMFAWYRDADVCYAYLGDVHYDADSSSDELEKALRKSRWFTRGWTLQELIAPSIVVFLNATWRELGTKASLAGEIAAITGIAHDVLAPKGLSLRAVLDRCCIAQRMSWASKRLTTRVEDMTYCLLGIFDVSMPLLYGEGDKAFLRLQKEIINQFDDDMTIFVWTWPSGGARPFTGLLAHSPWCFRYHGHVRPYPINNAQDYDQTGRRDGEVTKNIIQLYLKKIYMHPAVQDPPGPDDIKSEHEVTDDDRGFPGPYTDLASIRGMKIPHPRFSTQPGPCIVLLDCWAPSGQIGLLLDYAEGCWYLSRYQLLCNNRPILFKPADMSVFAGTQRDDVSCALILKERSIPSINPHYRELRLTMPLCQYGYTAREVQQTLRDEEDALYVLLDSEIEEYGVSFEEFELVLLLLSVPPSADGDADAEMPPFLLACSRTSGDISRYTAVAVKVLTLEYGSQEELATANVAEWCARAKEAIVPVGEQMRRQIAVSQTIMPLSARFDLVIKNRPSPSEVHIVVLVEEKAS